MPERFVATLPDVYAWGSQARQYPEVGLPGLSYFAGDVSDEFPDKPPVDCLLYRGLDGRLLGVLNHYPADYPPWEKRGNVNVWVHPEHQRRGIGGTLVLAAMDRWAIRLDQQRFTEAGAGLANQIVENLEHAAAADDA